MRTEDSFNKVVFAASGSGMSIYGIKHMLSNSKSSMGGIDLGDARTVQTKPPSGLLSMLLRRI